MFRQIILSAIFQLIKMRSVDQHNPGQLIHQLLAVVLILETPNIANETTLLHTYSSQLPSYPL